MSELPNHKDSARRKPDRHPPRKDELQQSSLAEGPERHATRLNALLNEAPLGIYIIDAGFRIWLANPLARQVFGNLPDLIGRDYDEVIHVLWPKPYADEIVENFRHTLESGEPYIVPERTAERIDTGATEYYEWQINRVPLPDGSYGVICYFRDISERVTAERQLSISEDRYRSLFNSIDEGYCIIEMIFDDHKKPVDYRFLEVNPSFEKQCGMHEATGKRMLELAPDHEAHWFETYGKVVETGEPIRFVHKAKELGNNWFDLYAFQLGDRQSHKVAVVFNNITERVEILDALRGSEEHSRALAAEMQQHAQALADLHRRKDEFLAMLSHELRSPLAPISNALELLKLKDIDEPLAQHARMIIERQVGQLKHLVDDLLEVSRISSGKVQLRKERIDASNVVAQALDTVRPIIVQRRHELTVSVPAQHIWLDADAARLEQVVVNLLTNAAKYTTEGGHIWLTVLQEGDAAVLRVRDTGVGISPEFLPRIFDLFTQADRSLDRSQGGLGIGLCLVHQLVVLHGGTVTAESVLGQGSEFVVRLPLMSTPVLPVPATHSKPVDLLEAGCRVVVVDDNADSAFALALLLRAWGHDVRMAHDGPSAVEATIAFKPDVVLLDIGLPGLDGFEVARRIRQIPEFTSIVLVAITGYGQETDRVKSREAGFDRHLVKPADFGELKKIVSDRARFPLKLPENP